MNLIGTMVNLAEQGRVPDALLRAGIRRLCRRRLHEARDHKDGEPARTLDAFAAEMRRGPVAPVPEAANEQHYELPAAFFARVLGQHLKYSGCFWPEGVTSLDEAEAAALGATCQRAELADGMDILELGCGWGSLSLWMAERCPASRITAVSNSASQRAFIESRAAEDGLSNLRVITADMNDFDIDGRFDRVVSVEMFEHMRNYAELLRRIAGWLRPDGKLFVHIFCHRQMAYTFETEGAANWMGRHFFTGGIMPAEAIFSRFEDDLRVGEQWFWSGAHYQKTAEAWLANLDRRREEIMPILEQTYGSADAKRWYHRWRIFFMACAELFGMRNGREWGVGHYLLEPVVQPDAVDAETSAIGAAP